MSAVVVIPARAGSKGIPHKNLRRWRGLPLVTRAIQTARESDADQVIVTSDSDAILEIAREHGAKPHIRPHYLAGDYALSEDTVIDAVFGVPAAKVILMQCTTPTTTHHDINAVIGMLDTCETVVSVTPAHVYLWDHNERPVNFDAGAARLPRQVAPAMFAENGALYGMRRGGLEDTGRRFFGRTRLYIQPAEHAIDIDTESDLEASE